MKQRLVVAPGTTVLVVSSMPPMITADGVQVNVQIVRENGAPIALQPQRLRLLIWPTMPLAVAPGMVKLIVVRQASGATRMQRSAQVAMVSGAPIVVHQSTPAHQIQRHLIFKSWVQQKCSKRWCSQERINTGVG